MFIFKTEVFLKSTLNRSLLKISLFLVQLSDSGHQLCQSRLQKRIDYNIYNGSKQVFLISSHNNPMCVFCSVGSFPFFFKNKFIYFYLFIYFWLHWVFVAARGLSLVAVSGGLLFILVRRLLTAVASLVAEHGLQACGLQQLWLIGSRAQAQQLWCTGLVAPWHVESSWTRA